MAEVVSKKSRKRQHNSQLDDNDDLPAKLQKVSAGKKAPSMEAEEASPPSDNGIKGNTRGGKRFKFPKRPVNKSWLSHIAANIATKLVSSAIAKNIDPRRNPEEDTEDSFVLSRQDLAKSWFFLAREYPLSCPLNDILTDLSPLAKVSTAEIMKQETKLKYKDQLPKQPATAYVQFVNSKRSKMMEKHPEMGQVDVTKMLAQKWREIGPDRKEKYIQRYETMKKQYKEEIEEFYSEHPDARPSPKPKVNTHKGATTPKKKSTEKTTEVGEDDSDSTEQRINELKKLAPKPPVTAYFLFVNAKRRRYKDKHPNMKASEITKNLADKWNAMSSEKQAKYKKVYEDNYKEYKVKLEEFQERYPDAKELLKRGAKAKRKPKAATVTSSTTATVAVATSSATSTKSGLTSPTSKPKSSLTSPTKSSVTSPTKSGITSPTNTTTNSLQNHKAKQQQTQDEEDSDNEDSDSGSSSDESSSEEEEEEAPTTIPPAAIITSKAISSKGPVARKEIRITKQESSDSDGSSSSSSGEEDSSSDSDGE